MPDDRPIRPVFEVAPSQPSALAWLQLVRLPNVFTAVADVLMGYLFTHAEPVVWGPLPLLVVASCLLYMAGMALNDVFDRDIDAAERPGRPIPSGRISLKAAQTLGWGLLGAGVAAAAVASGMNGNARPAVIGVLLAVAIVAYNRVLKRLPMGPLGMGACRFLNVLLGMSLAEIPWLPVHWQVAAGIGVYIIGVTWFARTEAETSNRLPLILSVAVMGCGVALLATLRSAATGNELPEIRLPENWNVFWAAIALVIGWRALRAIADPEPETVQAAVKSCLLGLIVLDAAVVVATHNPTYAVAVAALSVPMVVLGRWLYST